ncbi:MAG: GNAT family N-acetyltransferase [Actinomycetota bacterium]|nr:GNAT family N-acetyltransferase [Actinomycetota bacterium]
MEPVELTAGRLHLRSPVAGDWPAIHAACQDPAIQQWTTVPAPYTEQDAQSFVSEYVPDGWRSGRRATFAVCDATSGALLGTCGLGHLGIEPDIGHIGFWTAPQDRGQGITTQAVGAVCRWGFAALGLARIEWYAEAGNVGSRRVAEKAGFRYEGLLRGKLTHRGRRVDAWAGALLAGEVT